MGPEEQAVFKDEIIKHLKELVTNLEKENSKLSDDLKKLMNKECDCEKYGKPVDQIYEAAAKHREKLVALKEVAENQKKKISILREEKTELLDQVEQLEFDGRSQTKLMKHLKEEIESLNHNIKQHRMDSFEKDEQIRVT